MMQNNAATFMKSRLRADLVAAMRSRRTRDVAVIRELVAAIDNAEAPACAASTGPGTAAAAAAGRHEFGSGSAEVERLTLSADEVRALLVNEIKKRERAASEFERLGEVERAEGLRAEVLIAKRYV
jgi:uncharacterized protein YqeY